MKKKTISMMGIVALIGISCNETNEGMSLSGAARVVSADSINDRVVIDTTAKAITRNVCLKENTPRLQVRGLFSKNLFPKKGDILFFTIDSSTTLSKDKKVESLKLIPYHLN